MKKDVFAPILFLALGLGLAVAGPSVQTEIDPFLDRVTARLDAVPFPSRWKARVRSTETRTDKNWEPQKTTRVTKIVTVLDGERSEDIVEATETEKGKPKDVTDKYREEAREEAEDRRKKAAEGKSSQNQGRRELTRDQLFPFGPEKRKGYDFMISENGDLEGSPATIIRTWAKEKDENAVEGKYYLDPETLDVLRAELTLAKKPGVLKVMEFVYDLQLLDGGYLVPKKTRVRIHVGLVVKNIRLIAEEIYDEYEILTPKDVG